MDYQIIVTLGEPELREINNFNTEDIDVFEIRLDLCSKDFLKNEIISILKNLAKPILFTYRSREDSSEKEFSELIWMDIKHIIEEFNSSNNFLDIDMKSGLGNKEIVSNDSIFKDLHNKTYQTIYSLHNFKGSFTEEEFIRSINNFPENQSNSIYKFAVLPKSGDEALDFLKLGLKYSKQYRLILIVMGEFGIFSRLFGDQFGSSFTYACISNPRAPGQIQASKIREIRTLAGFK